MGCRRSCSWTPLSTFFVFCLLFVARAGLAAPEFYRVIYDDDPSFLKLGLSALEEAYGANIVIVPAAPDPQTGGEIRIGRRSFHWNPKNGPYRIDGVVIHSD